MDGIESLWQHTVERSGGTCTLRLCGELDIVAAADLAAVLTAEAERPGATDIVVDLTGVTFIDSTGISALVNGYKAAHAAGAEFTTAGAHGQVRMVLDVAGVQPILGSEMLTTTEV